MVQNDYSKLVTVILPTYSRGHSGHLEKAIQSVLAQTYQYFELIICDDGSVDNSRNIIDKYKMLSPKIKSIRFDKNLGVPALVSCEGYLHSCGYYIAMIFDDCVFLPDHLEVLVNEYELWPELGMVYGQAKAHWDDSTYTICGSEFLLEEMQRGNNCIPNVSVMIKRSIVESIGWYDPHIILKRDCDWDYWLRIYRDYPVKFIEKVIAEEYGTRLANSLGNSYTMYTDVVLKYVNMERNHLLKPDNIKKYDTCKLPEVNFTNEEIIHFRFLLLEHYIKVNDLAKVAEYMENEILDLTDSEENFHWTQILAKNHDVQQEGKLIFFGLTRYYGRKKVELESDLRVKQAFIFEQQRIMDAKQVYIDQQQKILDRVPDSGCKTIIKEWIKKVLFQ